MLSYSAHSVALQTVRARRGSIRFRAQLRPGHLSVPLSPCAHRHPVHKQETVW